jgi:hypothetical protein
MAHQKQCDVSSKNLKHISEAGENIAPEVAASFRELVDSVIVMARKPGEPYRLETWGRLAGLIGGPLRPQDAGEASLFIGVAHPPIGKAFVSAKRVVPVERIELPTFGFRERR